MKKLKPENYMHLLKCIGDIECFVASESIENEERRKRQIASYKNRKEVIGKHKALKNLLTHILHSNRNEELFASMLSILKQYPCEILFYWFQTQNDKYLELFELVEIDEANTGTDSQTGEIPTETVPEQSNKGD